MRRAQQALLGCLRGEPSADVLGAFALAHQAHQALQSLGMFVRGGPAGPALVIQAAGLAVFAFHKRAGLALAALGGALASVLVFPLTANHLYLGFVTSLLLVLLTFDEPQEREQLTASLLALPFIAFIWGGVTKVLSGAWFEGQALAHAFAVRPDLRVGMAPFLSREAVDRLSHLDPLADGAGPFRLEGLGLVLSNLVWLGELGVPLALLLIPWARRHAWWCVVVMSLGLQWVAHEWEFALLLLNLAMIASPRGIGRWGRPVVVVAMAALAVVHAGLVEAPTWTPQMPLRGGP